MNKVFFIICGMLLLVLPQLNGQKYFTKTGEISFKSSTPLEDIEAVSNSASSVIDMESRKVQWAVLIKSFEFKKALMQEHFNENYMESSKFPKATFSGIINDGSSEPLNLTKDGTFEWMVAGTLEIHGVTKSVTTPVVFEVKDGKIKASSMLKIAVADFNIEIPNVVRENIAKEISIIINANYESLEKS